MLTQLPLTATPTVAVCPSNESCQVILLKLLELVEYDTMPEAIQAEWRASLVWVSRSANELEKGPKLEPEEKELSERLIVKTKVQDFWVPNTGPQALGPRLRTAKKM